MQMAWPPAHPALTPLNLGLLKAQRPPVDNLTRLLAMPPEHLARLLQLPFTAVAELRSSLLAQYAPTPRPALALYDCTPPALVSTGSAALDALLGGGLRCGAVTEIFGGAGVGKTQVCLAAAAASASTGGTVAYIDTGGDFDATRLQKVVAARGGAAAAMARVVVAAARDPEELVAALQQVAALRPRLVVVDGLTAPLLPLVIDSRLPKAFEAGGKVTQLLHRLAATGAPPAVLVTGRLRGGREGAAPALGGVLRGLAHTRLHLGLVGEGEVAVRRVRGGVGDCVIGLGEGGVV